MKGWKRSEYRPKRHPREDDIKKSQPKMRPPSGAVGNWNQYSTFMLENTGGRRR